MQPLVHDLLFTEASQLGVRLVGHTYQLEVKTRNHAEGLFYENVSLRHQIPSDRTIMWLSPSFVPLTRTYTSLGWLEIKYRSHIHDSRRFLI